MIRRSPRPTSHFTTIRNDVLRDERLSYRARGVLVSILSRPDNWRISRDRLAREGKEGRDAVNTALNELTEFGYIERQKTQREDGTFSTELVVYDQPENWESTETDAFSADFQAPTTGKPTTGKPTVGKPVANRNTVKKKREEIYTINKVDPVNEDDSQFNEFWGQYPRKVGKQKAQKAFNKLDASTQQKALEGIARYTQFWEQQQTAVEYIPHPTSWINAGRWEDELTEPSASTSDIRQYDQPSRPQCDICDSTGYITVEDKQHRSWAHPCIQCTP